MNQLWLGWERPVKTDGCGWDIGGRVDLMYGSDWRYGECYGLETNLDAPNHSMASSCRNSTWKLATTT